MHSYKILDIDMDTKILSYIFIVRPNLLLKGNILK